MSWSETDVGRVPARLYTPVEGLWLLESLEPEIFNGWVEPFHYQTTSLCRSHWPLTMSWSETDDGRVPAWLYPPVEGLWLLEPLEPLEEPWGGLG